MQKPFIIGGVAIGIVVVALIIFLSISKSKDEPKNQNSSNKKSSDKEPESRIAPQSIKAITNSLFLAHYPCFSEVRQIAYEPHTTDKSCFNEPRLDCVPLSQDSSSFIGLEPTSKVVGPGFWIQGVSQKCELAEDDEEEDNDEEEDSIATSGASKTSASIRSRQEGVAEDLVVDDCEEPSAVLVHMSEGQAPERIKKNPLFLNFREYLDSYAINELKEAGRFDQVVHADRGKIYEKANLVLSHVYKSPSEHNSDKLSIYQQSACYGAQVFWMDLFLAVHGYERLSESVAVDPDMPEFYLNANVSCPTLRYTGDVHELPKDGRTAADRLATAFNLAKALAHFPLATSHRLLAAFKQDLKTKLKRQGVKIH